MLAPAFRALDRDARARPHLGRVDRRGIERPRLAEVRLDLPGARGQELLLVAPRLVLEVLREVALGGRERDALRVLGNLHLQDVLELLALRLDRPRGDEERVVVRLAEVREAHLGRGEEAVAPVGLELLVARERLEEDAGLLDGGLLHEPARDEPGPVEHLADLGARRAELVPRERVEEPRQDRAD